MDIPKLLAELFTVGENDHLEAKDVSELNNDTMETVCAFANTQGLQGGYILFGIAETHNTEKPYEIVGVKNSDKLQNDLATQCRSKFSVPIYPVIQCESVDGKTIIGAYIPESQPSEKPVFIKKQSLEKGTYIRIGPTDQVCMNDQVLRLLQDRNSRPYDETCIPETSLDDIEPRALEMYRTLRKEKDQNAPELTYSDEELLYALHCADKINGEYKPTIAGLLLFGTNAVLRRYFSMARFDYIRAKGRDWYGNNKDSDTYYSLELRESLMTLLPKAEAAIMNDIEREFSFPEKSLTREEKPIIPYEAVREVLVNAIMHRDYRVPGPTQAIRFIDRIEFRNHGYSLKPVSDLGNPGSKVRNETIASVLYETKYAENKGSGIAKVKRLMLAAQLDAPIFESSIKDNTFKATLSLHQLLDEESLTWLKKFKEYGLNNEETLVIVWTRKNAFISNEECRKITGYETIKASNLLIKLRDKGLLIPHSRGPGTYYELNPIYKNENNISKYDENKPENGLSPQLRAQSTQIEMENKPENGLSPQLKVDTGINARKKLLSELPRELQNEIETLGQRLAPDIRQQLVTKVCSIRPFTARELALLFNKRKEWAKKECNRLTSINILSMTDADKPNNKNQSYFTPQKNGQTTINNWK